MRFLIIVALLAIAGIAEGCAPEQAASTAPGGQAASTAPTPTEQAANPDSGLTAGQRNAIETAENYLSVSAFSKSGLIEQLKFEGYSRADAAFAVDFLDVDWKEQAVKSAANYLEVSSFSLAGLIEQLEYEGFTPEQAEYGAREAYGE